MDKLFERYSIGKLKSYELRILGVSSGKWNNNFRGLIFIWNCWSYFERGILRGDTHFEVENFCLLVLRNGMLEDGYLWELKMIEMRLRFFNGKYDVMDGGNNFYNVNYSNISLIVIGIR